MPVTLRLQPAVSIVEVNLVKGAKHPDECIEGVAVDVKTICVAGNRRPRYWPNAAHSADLAISGKCSERFEEEAAARRDIGRGRYRTVEEIDTLFILNVGEKSRVTPEPQPIFEDGGEFFANSSSASDWSSPTSNAACSIATLISG